MCALLFGGLSDQSAWAGGLKLATWNMDWLTGRPATDTSLPPGIYRRQEEDFQRIAGYFHRLDADIVGFQEVDGPAVAEKVFDPAHYQILMTDDAVVQRVGIAVRRRLHVERHPDLAALNVYPPTAPHALRSGLDVTISDGTTSLRVLVVHLKTGCWDNPWSERQHSCPTLERQFAVLDDWILERNDAGEAFAVVGDFNRRMTPHDPFYDYLLRDAPLALETAGYASPCWGGEYFIDHILLGGPARAWAVPHSLRVMTFRETNLPPGHISDHCPVSVRLSVP